MDLQVLGAQGPMITSIGWTFDPVYAQDLGDPPFRWAFAGDRIVATTGGEALGFDDRCPPAPAPLQGCSPNWLTQFGTTLTAPAAVGTDQFVFGGNDGLVHVLDAASGAEAWTGNAGLAITASPAVTGDTIVVGTYDGRVVAFPAAGCGAATCAPLTTIPADASPTVGVVIDGGRLLVKTATGPMVAYGLPG